MTCVRARAKAPKYMTAARICLSARTMRLLPLHSSRARREDDEGYFDHMAFMSRIKFHKLTRSYSGKIKFPYNSDDLAIYLLDLVEKY